MAKIMTKNKDNQENIEIVKLLIGASKTEDNALCYFERPVTKLVTLIENHDSNLDILLIRFPAKNAVTCDSQGVPFTS